MARRGGRGKQSLQSTMDLRTGLDTTLRDGRCSEVRSHQDTCQKHGERMPTRENVGVRPWRARHANSRAGDQAARPRSERMPNACWGDRRHGGRLAPRAWRLAEAGPWARHTPEWG